MAKTLNAAGQLYEIWITKSRENRSAAKIQDEVDKEATDDAVDEIAKKHACTQSCKKQQTVLWHYK